MNLAVDPGRARRVPSRTNPAVGGLDHGGVVDEGLDLQPMQASTAKP